MREEFPACAAQKAPLAEDVPLCTMFSYITDIVMSNPPSAKSSYLLCTTTTLQAFQGPDSILLISYITEIQLSQSQIGGMVLLALHVNNFPTQKIHRMGLMLCYIIEIQISQAPISGVGSLSVFPQIPHTERTPHVPDVVQDVVLYK